MNLFVQQMNREHADTIAEWVYNGAYCIYNMDKDDIAELLDGSYFSVTNSERQLLGFYCFGSPARIPSGNQLGVYDDPFQDIGLGIKPDLCGKGFGYEFLCRGLNYAKQEFYTTRFRLTVASFNKRAISVYEKTGFKKIHSFVRQTDHQEFWIMTIC